MIEELTENDRPHVIFFQEHWLTPANLSKFESHFVDYFSFGCSAMSECVDFGMLRGRPYGGVMMLIRNELRRLTETIHCDERYVVIRVANYLLVNVYLPCVGSNDRLLICDDVVMDISAWRDRYLDCKLVIAGDFNVDLDNTIANCINAFGETAISAV